MKVFGATVYGWNQFGQTSAVLLGGVAVSVAGFAANMFGGPWFGRPYPWPPPTPPFVEGDVTTTVFEGDVRATLAVGS